MGRARNMNFLFDSGENAAGEEIDQYQVIDGSVFWHL